MKKTFLGKLYKTEHKMTLSLSPNLWILITCEFFIVLLAVDILFPEGFGSGRENRCISAPVYLR